MNYLFPLVFFALMGIVMTQINPLFAGSMVPAMVIFAALASEVLGLPGPLVESREAGIYRSLQDQRHPGPVHPGHPRPDHGLSFPDRRGRHHDQRAAPVQGRRPDPLGSLCAAHPPRGLFLQRDRRPDRRRGQ